MNFIIMEMKINVSNGELVTFVDETVPLTTVIATQDNTDKLLEQAVCGFFLSLLVGLMW